jgi:hypothetical protein
VVVKITLQQLVVAVVVAEPLEVKLVQMELQTKELKVATELLVGQAVAVVLMLVVITEQQIMVVLVVLE